MRIILTIDATCTAPSVLFRHELGHTLGIFGHPPGGLMSAPMVGSTASQREINMLVQLYRLPHGAASIPTARGRSFSEIRARVDLVTPAAPHRPVQSGTA